MRGNHTIKSLITCRTDKNYSEICYLKSYARAIICSSGSEYIEIILLQTASSYSASDYSSFEFKEKRCVDLYFLKKNFLLKNSQSISFYYFKNLKKIHCEILFQRKSVSFFN